MNLPRSSNGTSSPAVLTPEEKAEADSRSVYIGNVSEHSFIGVFSLHSLRNLIKTSQVLKDSF